MEVLGYTHAHVGAVLLKTWKFPVPLVAAAEFCETPAQGPIEVQPLLAHLHAAKFIATSMGPGIGAEGFLFELNEAFLAEWGFTAETLQQAMPVVHERARARLQDQLTHGALEL